MSVVLWEANPGAQTAFLAATAREVLYGGAVGGGKSDALIAMPLRWVNNPQHKAIILRRERKRLQELIDRQHLLYPAVCPGVIWHETELRWKFPSGARIHMGYAEHEKDIENYKSDEFNLVAFDELTEFTEYQYTFMLSRNRGKSNELPLWMRSGTNPGGEGMGWVYKYFIENRKPYEVYAHRVYAEKMGDLTLTRQYIPSTVFDNPKLPNREEYIAGLASMDPETREAMLYGRWDRFRGQFFPKAPKTVASGIKNMAANWYVIRCMDYGWGDPTCVMWLLVDPVANTLEICGELYGPQMTTESIAHMVKSMEKDLGFQDTRIVSSVLSPDAFNKGREGGPSIAALLSQHGVWFTPADNDRVNGWANVVNLIDKEVLRAWEGRAPNLMRTLTKLPRDPEKSNDVKQKGVDDHAAECLRYGVMAFHQIPMMPVKQLAKATDRNLDPYWERFQQQMAGVGQRAGIPELGPGW